MYSFTFADSRKYTPEAKDAMNIMAGSVKRVVNHLGKVKDRGLEFYGISRKQRDLFCDTRYHITADMPYGINMGIIPTDFASKKLEISCGEEVVYLPNELVDKTMCHEFAHALATPETLAYHKRLKKWTRYGNHILTIAGCYVGAHDREDPHASIIMAGYVGHKIGQYLGIVTHYPIRREEFRCDDVADRMIPEITYGEKDDVFAEVNQPRTDGNEDQKMHDRILKFMGAKKQALAQQLDNRIVLQRLQYIDKTHPSSYSRYERSEKNCPLYLEQKRALKIPSLIAS